MPQRKPLHNPVADIDEASVFDKDKMYPDIREDLGIKKEDIVVTNVANLDIRKGQQYLIEAAVKLHKKFPVHVLLVGEGEDRERLVALSKENGAESYIHFLGRRSDINTILSNSDIFVLSSLHGALDPMYRHRDTLNRRIINQEFKVIAISKYLEHYFAGKGCKTIRIPAILTTKAEREPNTIIDKRIITYAGLPEKKDKLIEILDAFAELPLEEKDAIELRIIGITLEQLQKRFKLSDEKINQYKNGIIFYGRVSREEVLRKLDETHFTIFYRDASERYAKAGFPTKVAESTSKGIPVITNHSSDLADYLIDGVNSIVINNGVDGIRDALKRASLLSSEQYLDMTREAYGLYTKCFEYDQYVDQMIPFLQE